MKPVCPVENCTGCMSCSSVCSHDAIEIKEDAFGFLRPSIVEDRCTDCGACRRVCPELNRARMQFPLACYAAATSEQDKSSLYASGGVASSIARYVITHGGVVAACCGDDIFNVEHRLLRSVEELPAIRGSRYVQSRITSRLISEIRKELKSGRAVAFIGTGCQTAGMRNLFSARHDNFILIDLVCHGVPSQRMLSDNIRHYENRIPGFDPQTVHFREKHDGRITYGWFAGNGNGKKIAVPWRKDAYMAAFLDHLSLRPCCTSCRYAFSARATDLTLSDFWGLGSDSALHGRNGVSAVLVNTDKGRELFSSLEGLDIEKREIVEAIRGVGRLQTPSPANPQTQRFNELYLKQGLHQAASKTVFAKFRRERIKNIPGVNFLIRIIRSCKTF